MQVGAPGREGKWRGAGGGKNADRYPRYIEWAGTIMCVCYHDDDLFSMPQRGPRPGLNELDTINQPSTLMCLRVCAEEITSVEEKVTSVEEVTSPCVCVCV